MPVPVYRPFNEASRYQYGSFFLASFSQRHFGHLGALAGCEPVLPPVWAFGWYRWKARQSRPTPPRQEVFALWREADSQLGRNDCLVIRVVNLPTNSSVDPGFQRWQRSETRI